MDKRTLGRPDPDWMRELPLAVRYSIAIVATILAVAAFIVIVQLLS